MDELQALRQKKIQELIDRQQGQDSQKEQDQQQFVEQVAQLEDNAKTILTKEAISRLGNLKTAHPDIAIKAIVYVNELMQKRKVKTIDDAQFKQMLKNIQSLSQSPNIKITRK